jgi:hypothetical protein
VQVPILPLLSKCMGTKRGGRCDTDPRDGTVKKVDCCSGSCKDLRLSQVISRKTCRDCNLDAIDQALKVPETGALQTGSTKQVDGTAVRIATISGA